MDRYVYAGDSPVNLTDPSGALDTGALLGYAAAGCLTGIRNDLFAAAAIGIGTGQVELSLVSLVGGCAAGAGVEIGSQLGNPYMIAAFGVAESVNIVFSFLGAL